MELIRAPILVNKYVYVCVMEMSARVDLKGLQSSSVLLLEIEVLS